MSWENIDIAEEVKIRASQRNLWDFRKFQHPNLILGWFPRVLSGKIQQFWNDLQAGKRPIYIICTPPQHGKSSAITDAVAWIAGQDPSKKVIFASFSDRLGVRTNLALQRIFDSERYQLTFPKTKINQANIVTVSSKYRRNSELLEYVDQGGYFRNTTVGGPITGESLDIGIIDDPIKGRAEAQSETIRNKTWDWLMDDVFSRFSDKAGLLLVMTRWHVDDPAGRLLANRDDVTLIQFPAIAEADDEYRRAGEALFPEFKPLDFLLERQAERGAASWASLYQQRPVVEDGNMFKPQNIEIVHALPHGITWVRGWDLAATRKDGDWTVGAKLGQKDDVTYIADLQRTQGGPEDVERLIVQTAQLDGCRQSIPQDPGQAGVAQMNYLSKKLQGLSFSFSRETGDKATRAEPFAAQVNVGNVRMLRASWNEALLDELRSFPFGKHDDIVDACSRAYNELGTTWNYRELL